MSASPEFYNPVAAPGYSPRILLAVTQPTAEDSCCSCRTPTGAGISFIGEAATCPPAPRKPRAPPCRKRLFTGGDVVALCFDDLEAIFRPAPSRELTSRGSSKRGAILS